MATAASDPDPGALAWLRQSPPPFGVSIRKERRLVAEGVQLVETLCALGTVRVIVPSWAVFQQGAGWMPSGRHSVVRHSGGLVTRGFEVELADGGPDREALIWFIATECPGPRWGPGVPLAAFRSRVGCKKAFLAWVAQPRRTSRCIRPGAFRFSKVYGTPAAGEVSYGVRGKRVSWRWLYLALAPVDVLACYFAGCNMNNGAAPDRS